MYRKLDRIAYFYNSCLFLCALSFRRARSSSPNRKIEKAQYHGCNVKPVDDKKWEDIVNRLLHLQKIFGLGTGKENSHLTLRVDGKTEPLTPEQFLRIIPTGSLEEYYS